MTNLERTLIEKIRHLPPEKQRDMLNYAETLEEPSDNKVKEVATIWDEIDRIAKEIPAEEQEEMPHDSSVNLDHYLYGAPKRAR